MENRFDTGKLDWSVATRPLPGEVLTGDSHFVAETSKGWLLAVVDGLGHGPEAALAGKAFVEELGRHLEAPPVELLLLCHEALRHTRGCAASVATIDKGRSLLTWAGVGNVEGVIRHDRPADRQTEYITMRGGIVGYRIPALQPSSLQLEDGDTLVLATDGIADEFVTSIGLIHPPARLAEYILDRYAKSTDDALVLVARWHLPATAQEVSPS